MIPEAELRRLAAGWRVDPMVLDLDYSLTWFLAGLSAAHGLPERLRFKGGTCLRKCYFPGYRFSEDLDFTAAVHVTDDMLTTWVSQATAWSAERDGPDFAAAAPRLEVVEDDYGKESYQLRVYFGGALRWGGSPRAIRMDVTRDERLLLPAEARPILHAYSDAGAFETHRVACYALPEILAEKVRAVCGQRRFAISRDLYDIYQLGQQGIALSDLAALLPEKFRARGVDLAALDGARLDERRSEYERDWQRRLDYLIPSGSAVRFEQAWAVTRDLIAALGPPVKGHPR